jgi:hypothetical protein
VEPKLKRLIFRNLVNEEKCLISIDTFNNTVVSSLTKSHENITPGGSTKHRQKLEHSFH